MSRIVLIDGENLIYGLRKLMGKDGDKASRELFLDFAFRDMLQEVLSGKTLGQIFFYGARLRLYKQTSELVRKTNAVIKQQARLVNTLQAQKIHFVKVGYLRARESEACANCNNTEWHLMEKGVDVGLAVKMLTDVPRGAELVLITSDTDLLPAVKAVRLRGVKVTYIGYEGERVAALTGATDSTRLIKKGMVERYMSEKNRKKV